ncbi:transcriptional Coactivator p15-domain-containing protein [Kockovaella imperatae]|uniref:Transcriptional Coactivator p15-domain-containing protein n=1 Tax=Kockovaella imperatae TaxID=4999 RepID=A0A1Y1UH44_9TREE|nr:transcriptional Coactivator p15-domain-containing protein [Kockovaella imperatae]ORX36816.1 transcriptional Coactivator p15-domain-containing protein [Kockovaella imperatae]
MPKKKRVDSDEESGSEQDARPSKVESISEDEEPVKAKAKNGESSMSTGAGVEVLKNADKNSYFNLSDTRRVTVRPYSGKILVDVREFYRDKATGEMKPGSKGISLTAEQWKVLRDNMEVVDRLVEEA